MASAADILGSIQALPVDVEGLCRDLGLDVCTAPLDGVSGALLQVVPDHYLVVVSRVNTARRRFTIAHELGHYLLHRHLAAQFACADLDVSPIEREANIFAADLLMPMHLLQPGISGTQISRLCRVSRQAADIRLSEIVARRHL